MIGQSEQLDASLLRIGQEFAGYRVEAGLGRQSGVGRVYEATHLESDRRVALKVFTGAAFRDPALRARFQQTTQVQARLRHPSVVRVEDWGVEPAPFLVMSLIRGPTLADLLEDRDMQDRRALEILRAVALGLDAGARRGLVYHRLQPRGILIDEESGQAFLGDFGASRPARSTELIETGRLGTYADYIPPEEADDGEAGQAGTVYSLGAITFECLTGRPPFAASEQWATLRGHLEAPPPGPTVVRDDLPPDVDGVIERALAKDPTERQNSAAGLMRALDGAFPEDQRTGGLAPRRRARRPGRLAAAAAVVAAVLGAAALGALVSNATEPGPPGPKGPERVRNGDLALRYPSDWKPTRPAPKIEGLTLADPVAVAPRESDLDDGELVAGRIASGRLPPQTSAQVVDLRGVLGRRYQGLSEPGSRRKVVAYAIPAAGGGQVIAACVGPTAGTFASRCQRVASTVRARREGPPLAVASPGYARSLAGAVRRVDRVRAKGRRRLARARTPAGQRRITARVARDYRRLAGVMARIEAPAQARASHRRAVAQLRRAARGYAGMARAARARRGGRWISARNGVRRAEGDFQGSLRRLRRQGYDVR